MASPLHLALLALIFATQADGRRGGGGGSGRSGGDGDGGGGGGGAGGGGDALIDYTKDCKAAQAAQTQDLYLMPGSYYSGPLTITHKVDFNSAAADTSCSNNDQQTKQYVYDAILAVGPVRDGNDTADVFWGLQAYPPVQPVPSDARNEFVRIRSARYGQEERERKGLRFYYPYLSGDESALAVPWNESSRQYWNMSLSPTTLSVPNGTVAVDSWNISATLIA
ncbi:uncharacterized protein MYCGRDRAFT_110144 [Zymoseptoria tritici IPO323]|uniref:Uncharacterized protein n=1 Tax=Zymoseptoria tritici (strain CBS 115943 / IPO323) TaxID=336722 RepID=F9XFD8_ZYMTI|nr:uncharacterized protein MYCGRDRAFT_110144 [Zymoseptoria tritici IPO323]EGP85638.1 hypothetical protein MYCGRDRAFT_110144 [Zymoseptoria tritici IPO323]